MFLLSSGDMLLSFASQQGLLINKKIIKVWKDQVQVTVEPQGDSFSSISTVKNKTLEKPGE